MTDVLERAVTPMQECHLQNRHVSYLLNSNRNKNGPASGSRAGMTNELDKDRYTAEHRTFHYPCQHDESCPFSRGKVITIRELVLGKCHHERVLCGRICMQPYKDRSLNNALEYHKGGPQGGRVNLRLRIQPNAYSSVNTLLEDPDGARVRVVIFNVLPSNISEQETELRFPVGMRVAIRDPLYKVCVDGNTAVRVDNPGDISLFDQSYSDENEKFAADTMNANAEEDLETIRTEGNRLFRDQDWAGAVIKYSQCIDQALCRGEILKNIKDKTNHVDDVNRVLMLAYSNRAEARLRLADIEDAFSDADKALEFDPVHVKTLVRKAKAAHGLGLYEKACKLFETALKQPLQQPEEALISKSLEVSLTSLNQSRTGHFDLIAYYSRGGLKCDAPFCADFLGPLKIGLVNYGMGRRGLFATRDVEDGAIMLVSNPLALVWQSLKKESTDNENARRRNFFSQYLLNQVTKRVAASKRHKAQLRSLFSISLESQNEVMEIPSMELFTPGSEWVPPHPEQMEDDMDFARIATRMKLNSFGVNDDRVINLRSKRRFDEDDIEVYRGIWVLPSFLNHSCTPNCVAEAVGDAVFVRAIENIKIGEELTISYVGDLCANVNSRRQSAEVNWFFTCKCARCLWEEAMPGLAHVTMACQLLGKAVNAEMSSHKTGMKWQHTTATKDFVRLAIDIEGIIDSLDSKVDLKQRGWIRALFIDVYIAKCQLASDKESKTSLTKIIIDSLYSVSDPVGAHEWLFSQSAPIIEKYFQSRPRPTVPVAWMVGQSYPSLPRKRRPRPGARSDLKPLDKDPGRDKEPVSC